MPARNGSLDLARLIAAFGIVVFHAGLPAAGRFGASAIGYAGLPFFVMALVVLGLPAAGRVAAAPRMEGVWGFVAGRAARLLRPWLIWSAIYGALKLAEVAAGGSSLASEFRPWMLLIGPALHLWFLPFAFVVSALLPLAAKANQSLPRPLRGLLGTALVGLMLADLLLLGQTPLPVPLAQWHFALPAVLLGLALGLAGTGAQTGAQGRRGMIRTALAGAAALALCLLLTGPKTGPLQTALAFALLMLCLAVPLPASPLTRFCARAALWVYLSHPLILSLLHRAAQGRLGPVAEVGVAILLCLALAFVLDRQGRPTPRPG